MSGVGLSAAESGGKITFYGKDPIVPSCLRFGSMAAVSFRSEGYSNRLASGNSEVGKDRIFMSMYVRRCGGLRHFFELKWELINGRPPSFASDPLNPFLHYAPMTLWNKTRDGRWVMPCNVYPKLQLVQPPYSDVTIASVPFKMQCYSGAPMNLKRPLRSRSTLCDAWSN